MTAAAAAADLSAVLALTDPVRIDALLAETLAQERAQTAELSRFLSHPPPDVSAALESFKAFAPRDLAPLSARLAAHSCCDSAALRTAAEVSRAVHSVETALSRAEAAARRIEEIVDLRNSLGSVRSALGAGRYEAAAAAVQRYLRLADAAVLDAHSQTLLSAAQRDVRAAVALRLEEASAAGDPRDVRRFCRLFAPLGDAADGIARYAAFLRARCAASAAPVHRALQQLQLRDAATTAGVESFADGLARICEAAADVAQTHVVAPEDAVDGAPLWPGSVPPLLRALQTQCDVDGCRVFELFADRRNVSQRIAEIQGRRGAGPTEVRADPRELPPLLEEMALLCQTAELFDRYLRAREAEARRAQERHERELAEASPRSPLLSPLASPSKQQQASSSSSSSSGSSREHQQQSAATAGLVACSELCRRSQELAGSYLLLEEYYMTESTRVILKTEELNPEAIDMVFFVLQRCAVRSLMTFNANCVCVVASNIVNVISKDLLDIVLRGLKEIPPSLLSLSSVGSISSSGRGSLRGILQSAAAVVAPSPVLPTAASQPQLTPPSSQSPAPPDAGKWALLNCLDRAADDISKLHEVCRSEVDRIFSSATPSPMPKLVSCLDDFLSTAKSFRTQLAENIDVQFRMFVVPRLRGALDFACTARSNFELNQAEYAQLEAGDSPFLQLAIFVVQVCSQMEALLTPANNESLVGRVLTHVAERLENHILTRKYNQLGALQLDRDVRALQSQLGVLPRRAVRDKLARLSQIALFLNLDRVDEAVELWSDTTARVTWRLAPPEVRRILSLRVEFSRDKDRIATLRL